MRDVRMPALILLLFVAAGALALGIWARGVPEPEAGRLAWVATAQQFGPVGYRDPAGAMSPDGQWIAYSEGRFLRVRPIAGGPVVDLPPGEAQIRNLAWHPDSRRILTDGFGTQAGWGIYDRIAHTRNAVGLGRANLRQAAWSPDGHAIAGIASGPDGQELWTVAPDGPSTRVMQTRHAIAFPAWTPRGEIGCVAIRDGRSRLTIPCDGPAVQTDPALDAYGPFAFSPDGGTVYAGLANSSGTLDLWAIPRAGGRARRLTSFSRDSYAPSVTERGAVLFRVQSYTTFVALAPSEGGPSQPLATFQSETPSWDPTGRWIGVTYGTWRRVVDDAHYPDIAQDAGIIGADPLRPAAVPSKVVHASGSEDQSLCWSPNGRWIAFHSHKDQSDDIWLRPADGDVEPRRISSLGRGAETGWPRWSPDGRWLLFDGASRATHRSAMYVVPIDQESGAATGEVREVALGGVAAEVSHAEWLPDSAHVAVIAKEAPGRHVILTANRDGGDAHVVYRFESEHDAPGLTVSPDGRDVAFIAPAPDGFFQIFRMPLAGGQPSRVTTDPSNKTQPAWSPDGRHIAFTVWNYQAQFWSRP